MGKISAGFFMSLDGVAQAPEQWHFPYFNEEMEAVVGAQMAAVDTLLLGRRTYQEWAQFWPTQEGELADYMNKTPKLVVSSSLDKAEWQNTTILSGDVAGQLAELKRQDRHLGINGSIRLVRWLVRERLLDELSLLIHPIVLGEGTRLFGDDGSRAPLRLISTTTLSTGVIHAVYGPAEE